MILSSMFYIFGVLMFTELAIYLGIAQLAACGILFGCLGTTCRMSHSLRVGSLLLSYFTVVLGVAFLGGEPVAAD